MAGYIFTVSQDYWNDVCLNCLQNGYFAPYTQFISDDPNDSSTTKSRVKILSAFFGDLVTMKPGDNIYFLSKRRLYGIGEAKIVGEDCKYENYAGASSLRPDSTYSPERYLTTENTIARWVVFFQPAPYLFKEGVDMDDVLRFRPHAFRMLRAFQDVSFIKIDDEENRALKEFISLRNEDAYNNISENTFLFDPSFHSMVEKMNLSNYKLDINKALNGEIEQDMIVSEMFIEAAFLQAVTMNENESVGHWDYLTQQLIASPFKPIKYIDKIDVFGYRYSDHYNSEPGLITKYLLVELKKDKVNKDTLKQVMQYVDWVCHEYASGDYSRIEAYVLGSGITRNTTEEDFQDICQRSYIAKTHPATPMKWNNVKPLKYSIENQRVVFSAL